MRKFSLQFSQNGKQAKIQIEVVADNLAQAVMDESKRFNITTLHKCYEIKEDNKEKS